MGETPYSIGAGPATRVSLSLPEGTAAAIRQWVGKGEFFAFVTAAVERAHRKLTPEGTLVLDSEGLSELIDDNESVVALIAEARTSGMEVAISALTLIEAVRRRTDKARLNWLTPARYPSLEHRVRQLCRLTYAVFQ